MTELEISCLATDLPEFIEVDMAAVEVGQTVHISDLTLPEGVTSVALSHDHDETLAAIIMPKGIAEEETASDTDEEAAE